MQIRKANDNDLNKLVEIRLAYLVEDFNGINQEQLASLMEQLPNFFENHLGKDLTVYIAEDGDRIISSVFLLINERPANPNNITGRIGTILNVYTRPEYRRQGIAARLMKNAIDEAKEMKVSFLELNATKDGYPLYSKLGFEESNNHCTPMKYYYKK